MSAEARAAAEDIATQKKNQHRTEDDIQKSDAIHARKEFALNKTTKKKEIVSKSMNKTKNKNIKNNKNIKEAARLEIKPARKISDYMKPKPDHPSSSQHIASIEPGAAVAGISALRPGAGNENFSGEKRKPEMNAKILGKPLNRPRGLGPADCDWPDRTRRPRLSQSEQMVE